MTEDVLAALRLITEGVTPPDYGATDSPVNTSPVLTMVDGTIERHLAPEMNTIPVSWLDFEVAMEFYDPAFVLIESLGSPDARVSHERFGSKADPSSEVVNLINAARKRDIPVVYWETGGPQHPDCSLTIAQLADQVFTTAPEFQGKYSEASRHNTVGFLPFAAQPQLHHPFSEIPRSRSLGHIGLSGPHASQRTPVGLADWSARYNTPSEPDPALELLCNDAELTDRYRSFRLFLDHKSDNGPSSPLPRHLFELSASGAVAVTHAENACRGLYEPPEVFIASQPVEAERMVDALLANEDVLLRAAHCAWRRTLRDHTYSHRIATIQRSLGLPTCRLDDTFVGVLDLRKHSELGFGLEDALSNCRALTQDADSLVALIDEAQSASEREVLSRHGVNTVSVQQVNTLAASNNILVTRPSTYISEAALADLRLAINHYSSRGILAKSAANDPNRVIHRRAKLENAALWISAAGSDISAALCPSEYSGAPEADHLDIYNVIDHRFPQPENFDWRV